MISIIIPVLNEAHGIVQLLEYLTLNASEENIAEIIIVDGGSTDATKEKVKAYKPHRFSKPVKIITSEKGRAKQMNTGARNASGNILYFLHADSFPPKNYGQFIIAEVQKGNPAGCFRMQFDSDHWWLKLASWFTKFNWRACRGGDQSQFITKELFEEIGGYDESYIIYEDNILLNELYERKQFVVIQEKLKSSARLYEKHGVWKLQYHFYVIYLKRLLGADANELYAYYKKNIQLKSCPTPAEAKKAFAEH